MPLGFDSGVAQAQLAMNERYGDRLVNQLAQAGGMIENGLQKVHTMKELQSLSSNLSQISPESPDYQQKLMALGAAHPFAMQDPRGQALISMGNQAHLQWQHQQYAMQAADRADARATRHDDITYRRAVAVAGMRMKQGGVRVPFSVDGESDVAAPKAGFSFGAGMDGAGAEQPEQPQENADGFSFGAGVSENNVAPKQPAVAQNENPDLRGLFNKNRKALASSFVDANGTIDPKDIPRLNALATRMTLSEGGMEARTIAARNRGIAKEDYANTQAEISALRAQQAHEYRVEEMNAKAELVAKSKMPDSIKIPLMQLTKQAGIARRDADIALAERDANPNSAAKQALATRLDMVAKDHELKAISEFAKMKDVGGDNAEKIIVISPDGQKGYIPKSQLESALKRGYKQQ